MSYVHPRPIRTARAVDGGGYRAQLYALRCPVVQECPHRHRTVRSALRCARKLTLRVPDAPRPAV